MAATRLISLHAGRGKSAAQSLQDRIAYACNGEKTQQGALISTYACDTRTVVEEFALSLRQYRHQTGMTNAREVLAYQIRQSFRPGEVTPEEANRIGYELAKQFTKGKHAFLVATHTDRAHIHNHILFQAVTLDGSRKFKDFYLSGLALQRVSDPICLEHGLSVIEPRPYRERRAKPSYMKRLSCRQELRRAIDAALDRKPKDFTELIRILQEAGYEYRPGSPPAFREAGRKRFCRLSSLGQGYAEEDLLAEIAGKKTDRRQPENHPTENRQACLMIDIQEKLREGKGPGYERWAKVFNLKQAAQTLCFLQEQKIDTYDRLCIEKDKATLRKDTLLAQIREKEAKLEETAKLKNHIFQYRRTKDIYLAYQKSGYDRDFREAHRAEIEVHLAAKAAFDQWGVPIPGIRQLNEVYERTLQEKKALYREYRETKKLWKELVIARQNVDLLMEKAETKENRERERAGNVRISDL